MMPNKLIHEKIYKKNNTRTTSTIRQATFYANGGLFGSLRLLFN